MQNFPLYKKDPINFGRQSKLYLRKWRLKNGRSNRTLKFEETHRVLENKYRKYRKYAKNLFNRKFHTQQKKGPVHL